MSHGIHVHPADLCLSANITTLVRSIAFSMVGNEDALLRSLRHCLLFHSSTYSSSLSLSLSQSLLLVYLFDLLLSVSHETALLLSTAEAIDSFRFTSGRVPPARHSSRRTFDELIDDGVGLVGLR